MTQSAATHHWLSIDSWTCELRSDKNSYRRPCSVDRTVGDAPSNVCLWRPAAWTNTPKRTEKNLTVRSGISEAETTALDVLYWSYTDTKHRAASLRQLSLLNLQRRIDHKYFIMHIETRLMLYSMMSFRITLSNIERLSEIFIITRLQVGQGMGKRGEKPGKVTKGLGWRFGEWVIGLLSSYARIRVR